MLRPFTTSEFTCIAVKEYQLPFGAIPRDDLGWVIYVKLPFQASVSKPCMLSSPHFTTQLLRTNVTSTWASLEKGSTARNASVFPEVHVFVLLSSLNLPGMHKADVCLWLICRGHPMPCQAVPHYIMPVSLRQTWKKPRQTTLSAVCTQ